MRVVSQHGNVDLPYEQIVVCHAMESVIALYNGEKYVLGEYSSKEKAYKAMEMMREKYLQYLSLQGGESVLSQAVFQPNYWVLPKAFQFPQDDEIEV